METFVEQFFAGAAGWIIPLLGCWFLGWAAPVFTTRDPEKRKMREAWVKEHPIQRIILGLVVSFGAFWAIMYFGMAVGIW